MAKFGVPEEHVRKAFAEETLLKAFDSGEAVFYLALENRCKILGFAQTVKQDNETVELDRIVVFPEYTGKGLGTQLLAKALEDQRRKGMKTVLVKAGKDEVLARRFYEKNGFVFVEEKTVEASWGSVTLALYRLQLKPRRAVKKKSR